MNRRLKRAVAGRAAVLVVAAPGGAWVATATHPVVLSELTSAQSTAALTTAQPGVESQIRTAEARLSPNLRAPHPGRPEAITHPAADHMSARKPAGAIAGSEASLAASVRPAALNVGGVQGLDVSSFQGNVDWASVAANGGAFAYMKATEGTYYTDSAYFAQQYNGSYNAGLVRGAYHFAIPNDSTGAAQADYFVAHGGGWSGDGRTLPGTLDIEYNPYGSECYGLTQPQMVAWIQSFDAEYRLLTGRYPTIYTTTGWWSACTGNSAGFGLEGLAIANYSSSPGTLPNSWGNWNIWQYADSGVFPGDQDVFNGTQQQLIDFAYGPSTLAASVPLSCSAGDQRTTADSSVQPGVVVVNNSGYHTYTVTPTGQLQPIPTSTPSVTTPLVAVWQNSTDCTGAADSRNSWATGPTGAVYAGSNLSGPPARNFGDTSKVALWKPVVGMSPTSDAGGYWLVASDGGIFSYGDARFYGSLGGVRLVRPIVGMATTPDGGGYWMVASDGGVFAFGDATFHGSMGGKALSAPIAGMVPNGSGYTLIGQDGRTYPFA